MTTMNRLALGALAIAVVVPTVLIGHSAQASMGSRDVRGNIPYTPGHLIRNSK